MIEPGLLLHNRYKVIQSLGRGTFGETWEVDDRGIRKVLKVLVRAFPQAIKLFQREAQVLQTLNHPGTPKVASDGYFTYRPPDYSESLHCLVMEKIEGLDLKKWLEARNNYPITEAQAIDWLKQLVEILLQIHEENYFHRDIKPANIILKPDGQLVLIDFGAVKEITATYYDQLNNRDVTRIYTLEYAAPEQIECQASSKSDCFALGRTFVHLLTGQFPQLRDPQTGEIKWRINWRKNAPHISQALADLIDEMMELDADKRPDLQIILFRLHLLLIQFCIETSLTQLPQPIKAISQSVFKKEYRRWLQKIRVPKIALYGRSGAGKSSLINAILGKKVADISVAKVGTLKTEYYCYYREGWELQFVDSRGVGDSLGNTNSHQIVNEIIQEKLDIVLFVVPIDERNIENDRHFLQVIKKAYQRKYKTDLPVILVLNKIDRVDPIREWNPPYNLNLNLSNDDLNTTSKHQRKEKNIRDCLKARSEEYQELTHIYVPVCTLWNEEDDERFNIETLVQTIYNTIPDEAAKNGFGGATADKVLKKAIANRLTWIAAFCAFCAVFVVPDNISLIQNSLVNTIAKLAKLGDKQYQAVTVFLQELELQRQDAGESAFPITFTLGKAAIRYFIDGEDMTQVKQTYFHEEQRLTKDFKTALEQGTTMALRKIEEMENFEQADVRKS